MTYDPVRYWQAAGADPANSEHESHFRRTDVFARQEERLMAVLEGLEFRSILEVGCGWGRITKLVHERWPMVPYTSIDLSEERLTSAQRKVPHGVDFVQSTIQEFNPPVAFPELVLTVECLMHVKPDEIRAVVEKLFALSTRYVVSLDWAVPLGDTPIAPWNFCHDYRRLYGDRLVSVTPTDLQAIFVASKTPLHSGAAPV